MFNINYASVNPSFPKTYNLEVDGDMKHMLLSNDTNEDSGNNQGNRNHSRITLLSLIQTPLPIVNASAIYEKYKNCELITSFNRAGLYLSYVICITFVICIFSISLQK